MRRPMLKSRGLPGRWSICAVLVLVTGVAGAHHSFSMFDLKKEVTIEGTIADFQFTNPHTFIEVDVPQSKGRVKRYTLEGPTPVILKRLGWKRSTLKPGDRVKFVLLPLRNGAPGGMLHRLILPSGKSLGAGNEGALDD